MITTGIWAVLFLLFGVQLLREQRSGRGGAVVVARAAAAGGALCILLSRLVLAEAFQHVFIAIGVMLFFTSIVAVFAGAAIRWRKRPRRVVP